MNVLARAIGFAACIAAGATAWAQAYPSKPIRLVAPAPQGGGIDLLARLFGERMGQSLGQPIAVEKRLGAAGENRGAPGARAGPGGHTPLAVTAGDLTH